MPENSPMLRPSTTPSTPVSPCARSCRRRWIARPSRRCLSSRPAAPAAATSSPGACASSRATSRTGWKRRSSMRSHATALSPISANGIIIPSTGASRFSAAAARSAGACTACSASPRAISKARSAHGCAIIEFFGAPVGMIFTLDEDLEIGSWLDLGIYLGTLMIAARGHGLHTCPQAAFADFHKIIRPQLDIPRKGNHRLRHGARPHRSRTRRSTGWPPSARRSPTMPASRACERMALHLPKTMVVAEVGPRDGLQSFPRWIDTGTKVAIVDRLSDLGLPVIEVSSFAHPKVIPHLRDAEEVFERIRRRPGTVYRALVPNARGAERAASAQGRRDARADHDQRDLHPQEPEHDDRRGDRAEPGIVSHRREAFDCVRDGARHVLLVRL